MSSARPKRKPPVEVVKDPTSGVEVVVYYDREAQQFYGEVPQIGVSRGQDLRVVCAELRRNLELARAFDWRGVITVDHGGGLGSVDRRTGRGQYRSTGASLSFQYWRSELAPKPGAGGHDARFVERPHLLDVEAPDAPPWMREQRERGTDVHDHFRHARDGQEVIPYSDEAWGALGRLKEATERTREQLAALFKRPELLAAAATKLLPADVVQVDPAGPRDDEPEDP